MANGGGKCVLSDNPHVPLTSTRMEALGYLRAQQHLQQSQWKGNTIATMDNESTVKRHPKHKDEKHKKQWRKPDWDIWEAIRQIDTSRTSLGWIKVIVK